MNAEEKTRFEKMEEKLSHLDTKVDTMDAKLDDILTALTGDSLGQNLGLIREFKKLEEEKNGQIEKLDARIEKLEGNWLKLLWVSIGVALASGITVGTITAVLQKIIH